MKRQLYVMSSSWAETATTPTQEAKEKKKKKNKNIIEGLKYIFKGLNNKLNFDGSVIRGE